MLYILVWCNSMLSSSLRSRRLEVAGERENGLARGRHACEVSHEWLDFAKHTHEPLGECVYKEKLSHELNIHGIPPESIA